MKTLKILKYIFVTLGIIFLSITYYTYNNSKNFEENALTATGVVEDVLLADNNKNPGYVPAISFKTEEGKTIYFISSVSSNPPEYSKGDKVEVLYEASKPEQAKVKGLFSVWGATIIFGFLGFITFSCGCFVIFRDIYKSNQAAQLLVSGTPIKAKIENIRLNKRVRVGSKNPFQIHAQWQNPRNQKVYLFKSENIWFNPEYYVDKDEITVFIDRRNPKKYYMDISFLPKMA